MMNPNPIKNVVGGEEEEAEAYASASSGRNAPCAEPTTSSAEKEEASNGLSEEVGASNRPPAVTSRDDREEGVPDNSRPQAAKADKVSAGGSEEGDGVPAEASSTFARPLDVVGRRTRSASRGRVAAERGERSPSLAGGIINEAVASTSAAGRAGTPPSSPKLRKSGRIAGGRPGAGPRNGVSALVVHSDRLGEEQGEEALAAEIADPSIRPSSARALQVEKEEVGILRGLRSQQTAEVSSMALRAVDEIEKVAERSRNLSGVYRGALWSATARLAACSLALVQRATNTDGSSTGEAARQEAAADEEEGNRLRTESMVLRMRVANLERSLEEARRSGPSSTPRDAAQSPMEVDWVEGDDHGRWPRGGRGLTVGTPPRTARERGRGNRTRTLLPPPL